MANATQRFMSYAEGEGNLIKKRQIFNVSIVLHIGVAVLTCILLLIVMRLLLMVYLTYRFRGFLRQR